MAAQRMACTQHTKLSRQHVFWAPIVLCNDEHHVFLLLPGCAGKQVLALVQMAVKGDDRAQQIADDIKENGQPAPETGGTYYNTARSACKSVNTGSFAKKKGANMAQPTKKDLEAHNRELLTENHQVLVENEKLKQLLAYIHHVCSAC